VPNRKKEGIVKQPLISAGRFGLAVAAGVLMLGLSFTGTRAHAAEPTVRVGVQSVPTDAVFQGKDWQKPYGVQREITKFSSGGDMLQAFIAGRVDVANGGSARLVTLAARQPKLFYIIAVDQYGGDRYGVIVSKDSSITGVGQLKGKKIGVVQGSGRYATSALHLQKHGTREHDFQMVNMKVQDIRAAVQQGVVAAGVAWEPNVAIAETMGVAKRIVSMKGISESPNFILVRRDFAEAHHKTLVDYLAGMIDMGNFVNHDPAKAGQLAAESVSRTGIKVDAQARGLALSREHVGGPVTDDLIAELGPIAQSMKASHKISAIPDFKALINTSFYQQASKLAHSESGK
jgi:NitT/TauT family transport system substrate-binding protein